MSDHSDRLQAHVAKPEPRDLWHEGFHFGFLLGHAEGVRVAQLELDAAWAETARKIRAVGLAVSHAELERRRGE